MLRSQDAQHLATRATGSRSLAAGVVRCALAWRKWTSSHQMAHKGAVESAPSREGTRTTSSASEKANLRLHSKATSLSGELKQAKATIAEKLSDYRASSAYLSAAATKAEGEVRDLKQRQQQRPNPHPLQTLSCLTPVRPPSFSSQVREKSQQQRDGGDNEG